MLPRQDMTDKFLRYPIVQNKNIIACLCEDSSQFTIKLVFTAAYQMTPASLVHNTSYQFLNHPKSAEKCISNLCCKLHVYSLFKYIIYHLKLNLFYNYCYNNFLFRIFN